MAVGALRIKGKWVGYQGLGWGYDKGTPSVSAGAGGEVLGKRKSGTKRGKGQIWDGERTAPNVRG